MVEGEKEIGAIGYVSKLWGEQHLEPKIIEGYVAAERAYQEVGTNLQNRNSELAIQLGDDAAKTLGKVRQIEDHRAQLDHAEESLEQGGIKVPPIHFLYRATASLLENRQGEEAREVIDVLNRLYEQAEQTAATSEATQPDVEVKPQPTRRQYRKRAFASPEDETKPRDRKKPGSQTPTA